MSETDVCCCKICDGEFSSSMPENVPRILISCGHTVCDSCARRLLESSRRILCPFDRLETEIDCIDELPINHAILDFAKIGKPPSEENDVDHDKYSNDSYSDIRKLEFPCEENENHMAVVYCVDCQSNLCKRCSLRLHIPKVFRSHQIVNLLEKPDEVLTFCCQHPQQIASHYRKTDDGNQFVCEECYNECQDEEAEKGEISSIYLKRIKQIVDLLKECNIHKENVEVYEKATEKAKNSYKMDEEEAEIIEISDTIDAYIKELRMLFEKEEAKNKEELNAFLSSQKNKLQRVTHCIKSTRQCYKEHFKKLGDCQKWEKRKVVEADLKNIMKNPLKTFYDESLRKSPESCSSYTLISKQINMTLSEETFQIPRVIINTGSHEDGVIIGTHTVRRCMKTCFENGKDANEYWTAKLFLLNNHLYEVWTEKELHQRCNWYNKIGIVYHLKATDHKSFVADMIRIQNIFKLPIMNYNSYMAISVNKNSNSWKTSRRRHWSPDSSDEEYDSDDSDEDEMEEKRKEKEEMMKTLLEWEKAVKNDKDDECCPLGCTITSKFSFYSTNTATNKFKGIMKKFQNQDDRIVMVKYTDLTCKQEEKMKSLMQMATAKFEELNKDDDI